MEKLNARHYYHGNTSYNQLSRNLIAWLVFSCDRSGRSHYNTSICITLPPSHEKGGGYVAMLMVSPSVQLTKKKKYRLLS